MGNLVLVPGRSDILLATYIDLFLRVVSAYYLIMLSCLTASGPVSEYFLIRSSSPERPSPYYISL
jgi:hypothetical protein